MISVLLVDDHRALSDGIRIALEQTTDIRVTGQVTDGYAALDYIAHVRPLPDIVLTDLEMKGMNGLALLQHLLESHPEQKVIILTQHDDYYDMAFKAGAKGYLLKESGIEEIIRSIRAVITGLTYLDTFSPSKPKITPIPGFTTRELQIIKLIVDEYTTRQISEKLSLPFGAVETYTRNIRRKTGASNIAGIVKFALQNKICE
jgi:DNA-binding NarL/FixJ family response regulator